MKLSNLNKVAELHGAWELAKQIVEEIQVDDCVEYKTSGRAGKRADYGRGYVFSGPTVPKATVLRIACEERDALAMQLRDLGVTLE
jgi:hypothetical protein